MALVAAVVSTVAALAPAVAWASIGAVRLASQPLSTGKYGSFSFSGSLSGTLAPLRTTCGASKAIASLEFVWFGKVGTLKGVPASSNVVMEIDLGRSRYGTSGHFRNVVGKPPLVTFSSGGIGTANSSWRSVSGTYSTAKRGASGSVDVSMVPTGTTKGRRLTIRGMWKVCA